MAEQSLVAVVGIAGRFPEADNVEQYWRNLRDGRECLTDLTDEELLARGESPERLAHRAYVRRRPLVPDMEGFDARLFGMTPRDAEVRDPQHRMFLEVCYSLFEHAGYDPGRYRGSIGVYAGVNATRYAELHLRGNLELAAAIGDLAIQTGNHPDYVTSFVSYKLGLSGPAMTVATACSTSLVCIHLASQAVRAGECDMAIAGGVEVEWPYGAGYLYSPGGIESPDGYCRPFDVHAAGTVFGSGAGAVLLKRYVDAVADGDTVYALVRGSAVNNDAADKVAFSAPSVSGQAACVAEALASAEVDPSTLSYVEAHGTATKLGDPIELRALTRVFRTLTGDTGTGYCGIGSVKSNVGHLGPASGVAGFIKTVLALRNELIPPSINFTAPNPALELEQSPFYVVGKATPWPADPARPRRAGCSSFGVGGTNAHVVLEEAPRPLPREPDQRPQLVVWSAQTPRALTQTRERLAKYFAWEPGDLADAAYTLRTGRPHHRYRDAVVATTGQDAADQLLAEPPDVAEPDPGPLLLAFPGQGAQYPGMAHGLHAAVPAFREPFDRCLDGLSTELERDLYRVWRDGSAAELAETVVAQPLLFAVEYALAATLRALGLPISGAVGHSLGELTAAAVAGVLSEPDCLRLVAARARAMQDAPRGAMLAVSASEHEVAELLGDGLSVAAVNGRRQVVVAGSEAAIGGLARRLAAAGVASQRLATSHAYHSPQMADAAEQFQAVVGNMSWRAAEFPVASCRTGALEQAGLATPDFWVEQLVNPVRFGAAVTALVNRFDGGQVLEVGPGRTLARLLRSHPLARRRELAVWSLLDGDADQEHPRYLDTLASLWRSGYEWDWSGWEPSGAMRVALPGYPFERVRYLVERPAPGATGPVPGAGTPGGPDAEQRAPEGERQGRPPEHPVAGPPEQRVAPPQDAGAPQLVELAWTRGELAELAVGEGHPRGPSALVLLPAERDQARRIMSVVQRAGLRPVPVGDPGAPALAGHRLSAAPGRDEVLGLVGDLAAGGELPDTVVDARLCTPAGDEWSDLDRGFYQLLWLIQAMQRYRAEAGLRQWRLVVLARHAVDVSGAEPLRPARAMLAGLVRTLPLEISSVTGALVDVGERAHPEAVAPLLRQPWNGVAAVRRGDLWLPSVRLLPDRRPGRSRLRRGGVYLITGGLGALGTVAARALAGTGLSPNLVLLGRHADPESEESRRLRAELDLAGAQVEIMAGDVGDEAGMRRVRTAVRERFGSLNGVLHAAGVAGGRLLERQTREEVDRVLHAKLAGCRVLSELLESEPALDFVVHYGSRAALAGLLGSGDYAAANAYLDAAARAAEPGEPYVVCVAWPSWDGAGMAVAGRPDPPAPAVVVDRTFTGQEWFLDEHRVQGTPVLSGTTYLDLVVRAAQDCDLVPAGQATVVKELVFVRPLAVPQDTEVRLEFHPQREGHRFAVLARSAGRPEWTRHAQGTVLGRPADPRNARLDVLFQDAVAQAVKPPAQPVFELGPRWDNVVELAARGEALVVQLKLPAAFADDPAAHLLHPALLDNATSVIRHGRSEPHLPFLYREVVLFRPLPAELVAVATDIDRQPGAVSGTVDLYDRRGRHLAHVSGFTMRASDPERFAAQASDAGGVPAPDPGAGWLSPDDGAAALLRIIDSDLPASVAVLPAGADLALPGHLGPGPPDAGVDGIGAPASSGPLGPPARRSAVGPGSTPAADGPEPPAVGSSLVDDPLRLLWEEVLGEPSIRPEDDFFDLGGTSLAVVQLVSRIRDTIGVEVGVGVVFEHSTLAGLQAEIARLGQA